MNMQIRRIFLPKKKVYALLIILFVFISSSAFILYPVFNYYRAVILAPRFGCSMQGPYTFGPGLNTSDYLENTMTFWVSPDPAESPMPSDWKNKDLWSVALIPSMLPTANCTKLIVDKVIIGVYQSYVVGGFDTNPIIPTALGLVCKIPADIKPLTYNLAIGFRTDITAELQNQGEINLEPSAGSWQSPILKKTFGVNSESPPFLLIEPNCVVIPWEYDAKSSDSIGHTTIFGNKTNPFSFIHWTDVHFTLSDIDWLTKKSEWINDSLVLAPNFVAISGDFISSPYEEPEAFNLAYNTLKDLGIPLIIGIGNHDQKLISPWRHYFGPIFTTATFGDVSIISIDSTLPLGAGIMNWIDDQARKSTTKGPTFIMSHYAPADTYFLAGGFGIMDIMLNRRLVGVLSGHSHDDCIVGIRKARDSMIDFMLGKLNEDDLSNVINEFDSLHDYSSAVTEPLLFMTRTTTRDGSILINQAFPHYSGYRRFSIINNQVFNYTYDYNNDGVRDPQISIPNGRFKTITYQESTNWVWSVESQFNEPVDAACAIFRIPLPTANMKWDLVGLNKTNGAYIRNYIQDTAECLIEVRVPLEPNSNTSIVLEEVGI